MRNRNAAITIAILLLLVVSGTAYHALATAASKRTMPEPALLSQEYLKGSMQGSSGIALDLNSDGNEDIAVGAPYASHKGSSGCLVLYFANPKGFSEGRSTFIKGEGNLGWSLVALGDMDGDGKGYFAASAVNGSGDNASLSGTVIVYKGGHKPREVIVLEGENALDRFGFTMASGDLNGDSKPDLIVGAPLHSPSPSLYQQGAVYVYFGPGYSPANAVKIPATPTLSGIGFSLAAGDINNDNVDDLLIGASGKVVGYYGGSSFPSPSPDVNFTSRDGGFGRSVAVIWDMDQDGFRDVAVGAYQAVINGVSDVGRLFILKGGSGARTVNADLASPDRLARVDGELNSGQFASKVASLRDASGNNILAVSAVHADGNPWLMTGKIFLFSGNDLTTGTPLASVSAIPGESKDMHLGTFVAAVAGKWGKWLAAGAPTDDTNTGSVRLFGLSLSGQYMITEK